MLSSYTTTFTVLLSVVSAVDFTKWAAPGPNDVRSPCPGLNSLANHGILARNGKGLTVPILNKALKEGLNVGPDFATVIGSTGILAVPSNQLAMSFDLDDIRRHDFPIEHDASLSRAEFDLNNGDTFFLSQSIFDTVLAYYDGTESTSIPIAA